MPAASSVLSVRLSPSEKNVLERAAAHAHTTISDFVRRQAVIAAELEIMDRRVVDIPADKWDEFEAWANAPPRDVPELKRLAATRPVWET